MWSKSFMFRPLYFKLSMLWTKMIATSYKVSDRTRKVYLHTAIKFYNKIHIACLALTCLYSMLTLTIEKLYYEINRYTTFKV